MKNDKLILNKFKVASLSTLLKIRGGDGNNGTGGPLTLKPKKGKCINDSEDIVYENE